MPNKVEFFVPDPAQLPLVFTLAPAGFMAQFTPMMVPGPEVAAVASPLPNPSIPNEYIVLLADALDSGYGSNATPMPTMPLADRIAFYWHLALQLDLAFTLVKPLPPVGWVLQPFASEIEKTAKTTYSYLLGMLYTSVATRLWGEANGWGNIREFWHYGVLASRATNFMAGVAYQQENPDFLVEFHGGAGTWACVEAKGTLHNRDDAAIKKGLSQACKLTQVKWQSIGAPVTVVSPAQQACVMTYFHPLQQNSLEVVVIDPPADTSIRPSADSKAPLFFKQGGDLVRWGQALDQFESMAKAAEGEDPRLQLERFDWARTNSQHDVWVGVPKIMRTYAGTINSALVLLDWLVPYLSSWRKKPSVTPRGVNMRLANMASYAKTRANTVEPDGIENHALVWSRVALFLDVLRKGNKEVLAWEMVLRDIWSLQIFRRLDLPANLGYSAVKTLEDLWTMFSRAVVIERDQWEIADAANGADAGNVPYAKTMHGLIVVALSPDSNKIVRTERRPLRF
ncbi:hypothetical protein [Caballeronia eucalypticola]|uniref:hypothetical protein n=1 Tax=Caballeronia sp. 15715 TaxID=3391030 RepID=UPI0039E4A99E